MRALTWKAGAIVLLAALILVGGTTGFGWWLAARDRDAAAAALADEQVKSAKYLAALEEQNRAVQALGDQRAAAEERGAAAQLLAKANGRRLDMALQRTGASKATTCKEAMPTVDIVLEAIR